MFKDLSFYQYRISTPIKNTLNIGWLDNKNDFSVGKSSSDFYQKLEAIIIGNEHFNAHFSKVRCIQPCNLCGEREITIVADGKEEFLGMTEILIPDVKNKLFFASPSMVVHYIKVHNYLPPQSYIDAVLHVDLTQSYCAEDIFKGLLPLPV